MYTLLLGIFVSFLTLQCAATDSGQRGTKSDAAPVVVIHMGGFFAFQRSPILALQPQVAQTALDHVNSLGGILDGYHLEMRWNWTGVSGIAKKALFT